MSLIFHKKKLSQNAKAGQFFFSRFLGKLIANKEKMASLELTTISYVHPITHLLIFLALQRARARVPKSKERQVDF